MQVVSVNYTLKWEIKDLPKYKWSVFGKLFNTNSNRQIKKTVNGGSVGYWIAGKFITLDKLRDRLQLIKNYKLPF